MIYNFIIATIAYGVQWLDRLFFHWEYLSWSLFDWWMFISIFVIIGSFIAYLTPFYERWLHLKLEIIIKKVEHKHLSTIGMKKIDLPTAAKTLTVWPKPEEIPLEINIEVENELSEY